jgi:hypothetical protein
VCPPVPPPVPPKPCPPCPTPTQFAAQVGTFGLHELLASPQGTSWNDPNACPVSINVGASGGSFKASDVLRQMGWINSVGGWEFLREYAQDSTKFGTVPGAIANVTANAAATFLNAGVSILDTLSMSGLNTPGCDISKVQWPLIISALSGSLERWLGISLPNVTQSFTYQVNAYCPYSLPTQGEINTAWLANTITTDVWKCWTRAIGNLDGPAYRVLQTQRTRASIGDLISLWQRQEINSETLRELAREQGVVDDIDLNRLTTLAQAIPAISDIIRFMTRDSFDQTIVDKYKYDEDFDKKYTLNAEKLGLANGLDRNTAKLYWRAHWNLPSNTQLYEMFHRLRPGRVHKDLVTTRPDVEEAIRVNDMSPFWTPRLVEIAYRQLGRTDARRAYLVGAIDRQQFIEYLKDFGFTDENANALARSTVQQKYKTLLREKSYREFLNFQRNDAEMRKELAELGYEQELIDKAVVQSERTIKSDTAKICLKAMRRMFMVYEEDKDSLYNKILATGLSAVQVNALLSRWECERAARGKLIPATQLCYWYSTNLIDKPEFIRRLKALGYSQPDSIKIAFACEQKALLRTVADVTKEVNKVLKAAQGMLPAGLQ